MREPLKIHEERLRACLRDEYGLVPTALEFLPRGKDYSAGLWRVLTTPEPAYLLKVTARPLYEPVFRVPHYLREQGVASVVAPLPTQSRALWTKLEDWTAIVYPYIEGDTSLTGMTDALWQQTGTVLRQIHAVPPPPDGAVALRREKFDPTEYIQWVRTFKEQHLLARPGESASQRRVRAAWAAHASTIHTVVTSLETLSAVLRGRAHTHVICHADLHAANLIRDNAGRVFVIDWDEVMLAPPERDFIFIREAHAVAFWQGYGPWEIDWTALTYYCWERVVQDLIACAGDACFRDDLGEETKLEIAELFEMVVDPEGSSIRAARAAAGHLGGGVAR